MPSQWGRDKTCPTCGLTYKKFRTGLRFGDIVQWFWINDCDSSRWRYKRRNTILGAWHGAKKTGWELHLHECRLQGEYHAHDAREPEQARFELVEGVPF